MSKFEESVQEDLAKAFYCLERDNNPVTRGPRWSKIPRAPFTPPTPHWKEPKRVRILVIYLASKLS